MLFGDCGDVREGIQMVKADHKKSEELE